MEVLASHGFITIAPDHLHNTYYDAAPERLWEVVLRRPQDLTDTVDWLLSETNNNSSDFHGCAPQNAGFYVAGHSFGGYTALATAGAPLDLPSLQESCTDNEEFLCDVSSLWDDSPTSTISLRDERVLGTIALSTGVDQISKGTLILTGDRDTSTPLEVVTPLFTNLGIEPRYFGIFKNVGHVSFSNACDFTPQDFAECNTDYRPFEEVQQESQRLILTFLRMLEGDTQAEAILRESPQGVQWTHHD